ncbi:MAG: hypothetical protein K5770_20585, partial [Lachnospiraceae bacterium]|nr:hypothetical protein [Lachnospiraceae bacterium]
MSGELYLGDLKKKEESLNKTGGINTEKSVFSSSENDNAPQNPYAAPQAYRQAYMPRMDEFVNKGPLMETRIHTTNSNDIAFEKKMEKEKKKGLKEETKVDSEEKQNVIKARSDLRVFTGDVMKNGAFTRDAKEAARHFFKQLQSWAGSFQDGGSGFYQSMGINGVLDCLYVDGMNLRSYLKEQYFYKMTGKPAQDEEMIRNYVALLVARGNHVLTMVRPNVKSDGAEVEYRNLYVDLTNVDEGAAANSRKQKEKGDQVRRSLKKRLDKDMTERTGMAYREAYGCKTDGFKRIEDAKKGLNGVPGDDSEEYKEFKASFDKYNGGLQKLGLKPGRDDINVEVAEKLKERNEAALKAAEDFLRMESRDEKTVEAVKKAKKELETDLELLNKAIDTKLSDEGSRMRLDELLDSGTGDDKGNRRDPEGAAPSGNEPDPGAGAE